MAREKFSLNPFRPNHTKFCEVRQCCAGRFTFSATHYNVHKQWGPAKDRSSAGYQQWRSYSLHLGFIELEVVVELK